MSDLKAFVVAALHDGETTEVAVQDPTQEIYAVVLVAFGWDHDDEKGRRDIYIEFGGEAVAEGDTFEDRGIEEGARLIVRLPAERKATVQEVAEEVHRLNPGVSVERLMRGVKVDPEDPSRVIGNMNWGGKGIRS